jgi:hypothetical protein
MDISSTPGLFGPIYWSVPYLRAYYPKFPQGIKDCNSIQIQLPAGFGNAGKFSIQSQVAKANSAHVELAHVAPLPSTKRTAMVTSNLELWWARRFDSQTLLSQIYLF